MKITPTIRAAITLEPFSEKYLTERYVSWLNDPAVVRYSEQRHRRHSLASCADYLSSIRSGHYHFWAIVSPEFGHIGNITASIDVPNRVGDIAIMIGARAVQGRGFGKAAWSQAMEWLLREGGMRKVAAGTMAENAPMLAIMRATGMHEEGRRRGQLLLDGRPVDLVLVARFSEKETG
jgi:[ribosomal protein S5]-alanine N-acetyltransferase